VAPRAILLAIPVLALLVSCTTSSVAPPVKLGDASAPYDAGDLDGLTDDQLCQRMCSVTSQINCPDQVNCLSVCMDGFANTPCAEDMRAVIDCFLVNGPSILTCDPTLHKTVLRAGYCTAEQAAIVACSRDAGSDAHGD
jgi:hypothetical protein